MRNSDNLLIDGQKDDGDLPVEMRRAQILAFIKMNRFARVTDLGIRFGVSDVTVRGDLDALAGRGHIQRVRGGAVPHVGANRELPFEEEVYSHSAEKSAIGRVAASLINQGETIILDVGTTTTAVGHALLMREELRDIVVFTNALNIALELEIAVPRITVVVTGGTLQPIRHSLVNPLGSEIIERINAHTIFMGCNGIDPVQGITNTNLPEAEIKQRMLRAARRCVIVADGSKIGKVEVAYLCGVEEVDLLITDSSADPVLLAALRERGLEVVLAD